MQFNLFRHLKSDLNSQKIDDIILTKRDASTFYILKKYYNEASPNIAVLGDKKKFKQLINYCNEAFGWNKKPLNKSNKKVIKINNSKITYIINTMETTIVLINSINDFEKHNITYKKYL